MMMRSHYLVLGIPLVIITPSTHMLDAQIAKITRTITIKQLPCDFKHEPAITLWIHGTQRKNSKQAYTGIISLGNLTPKEPLHKAAKRIQPSHGQHQMYTFLWSGELSFKNRLKAAVILYRQLHLLSNAYQKKWGIIPKMRIITHSHGGNVALNLAPINHKVRGKLFIDELILLACPVQRATEIYIDQSIFGRIYALYSKTDFLQVLDPQGFHDGDFIRIFSKRRFPWHKKLTQAELRINNKRPAHNDFRREPFLSIIPRIIHELDEWDTTGDNRPDNHLQLFVTVDHLLGANG